MNKPIFFYFFAPSFHFFLLSLRHKTPMIYESMKILYVYENIVTYGGVERIFVDKMNYLVNNYSADVFFLTYNQGSHQMSFKIDEKVRYADLGIMFFRSYRYHGFRKYWDKYRRLVLFKNRLKEYLDELNPDIIITTTIGPVKYLLRYKGDASLVIESHSGFDHIMEFQNDSFRNRYKYRLQKNRIKKADCVVSLTERDASLWRKFHHHVIVIPNFIHPYDAGRYSTLDNKQVIFVGRYSNQKAIPDLVDIWKMVNQRHPDWCLELYGKGLYEEYLKEIVNNNFNISCHPPTSDIFSHFIESSLFVLTSYYEPFGLAVGEAMSCGLPVVAFEGDGPCSIITDGHDGFIIKGRNKTAFADRVCQLIEDKEYRQKIGRNAISSVQRYSISHIMPLWKELFESFIK